MSEAHTVTVSLLDKDYKVACPVEQEAELIVSASYLDQRMRSIREGGKVRGLERIVLMAALNITHDLLKASEKNRCLAATDEEIENLGRKVDEALTHLRRDQPPG